MVDTAAAEAGLRDDERGPRVAEQMIGRHAHVLVANVAVRTFLVGSPPTATFRTMFTPGVSVGTISIDMPWYGLTSGSLTAITIRKLA